jgi:hypothetical protein
MGGGNSDDADAMRRFSSQFQLARVESMLYEAGWMWVLASAASLLQMVGFVMRTLAAARMLPQPA